MNYLSVCSGIEAASVAWQPLGWTAVGHAEIEPFPCAVLKHHYPGVRNYGDITKYKDWGLAPGSIDILVGGSPCQSFSVAGLRKGLADPRGNLALVFLGIADLLKPKWVVWENVPGVLSSSGGRDFGAFLGALGQLGYGFSYRVLDAQFFGIPQRRRRVFVVAHFGDWTRAAAVLFEREGLRGDPPKSRQKRKDVAPTLASRTTGGGGLGTDFDLDGGLVVTPAPEPFALAIRGRQEGRRLEVRQDGLANTILTPNGGRDGIGVGAVYVPPWEGPGFIHPRQLRNSQSSNQLGIKPEAQISDALTSEGPGAVFVTVRENGQGGWLQDDKAGTVDTNGARPRAGLVFATIRESGKGFWVQDQVAGTVDANMGQSGQGRNRAAVIFSDKGDDHADGEAPRTQTPTGSVRRLSPRECEFLQGFSGNYTQIPWRGRIAEACPDGPRYKALGNSMAVPVMRWIGERIKKVEALNEL
jgi:DNA (cytosine-5)-methyltransferase 1